MRMRVRVPVRLSGAAASAALVVGLLAAAPASAEPYPSQGQVDAAKAAIHRHGPAGRRARGPAHRRQRGAGADRDQPPPAPARTGTRRRSPSRGGHGRGGRRPGRRRCGRVPTSPTRARSSARSPPTPTGAAARRRSIEAVLGAGGPQDLIDRAGDAALPGQRAPAGVPARPGRRARVAADGAEQARARRAGAAGRRRRRGGRQGRGRPQRRRRGRRPRRTRSPPQLAALRSTSVALEQQRQARLRGGARRPRPRRRPAPPRSAVSATPAPQRSRRRRPRRARPGGSRGRRPRLPRRRPSRSARVPLGPTLPRHRRRPADPSGSPSGGEAAVSWARSQIGKPYQWGAAGPDGTTARPRPGQPGGTAAWVCRARPARSTRRWRRSPTPTCGRATLVFYGTSSSAGSIYHVAIYSGSGRMIEAPRAGVPVRETSLRMSGAMPVRRPPLTPRATTLCSACRHPGVVTVRVRRAEPVVGRAEPARSVLGGGVLEPLERGGDLRLGLGAAGPVRALDRLRLEDICRSRRSAGSPAGRNR